MANSASSFSINLAKNQGESFTDRFIAWALTIGRLVVILVESVALGAFLFRFTLDRQLVDLHDKIKSEQAIVSLLASNEKTYRNLQDKLSLIKAIQTATGTQIKTFDDITSYIPADMTITSTSLSPSGISLDGSTQSILSLSSLISKLKKYPSADSVSLDKIENRVATGSIIFTVTVTFKNATPALL